MEIVVVDDRATGGRLVADAITDVLATRDRPVLGLATGSSPEVVYDELIARFGRSEISFARTRAFLLDEYVGLPVDHPQSYRSVIRRAFVDHVDLPDRAVHSPDGTSTDVAAACSAFDDAVRSTGVDLQLLGVGSDGHIGFNEPSSSLGSRTRLKTLTQRTREDNARFFGNDIDAVPQHVLTQGIGTILEARHLVLLAWGGGKADAVAALAEGPVTAMVPASALQLHPHVTVVVDAAAAGRLELVDYYRQTWTAKPPWQGI